MYLTKDEEKILSGEYGEVLQKAMEIIVKVGELLGALRLIDITHAHASGVSYGTIGEPGLQWLKSLASSGLKARVYATVNPIGFDPFTKVPRPDPEFFMKQLEIMKAFEAMGFDVTLTCTPYYLRRPKPMERLAWGESNAVAYANSVLGAFTNREGGPVTVAAALTGKIYEAGLQLLENRKPTLEILLPRLEDYSEYAAAGYRLGEIIGTQIPYVKFAKPPEEWKVKALLAASAASGGVALAVLDGITPKGTYVIDDKLERVELEPKDLEELFGDVEEVDLIYHGCPHSSPTELKLLNSLLSGKVKKEFWVSVAPKIYEENKDVIRELEMKGVRVLRGTCPVVAQLKEFKKIATTSAKAYFYLRKKGFDVVLFKLKEVSRVASG